MGGIIDAQDIILVSDLRRGASGAHVKQVQVESVCCLPGDILVPEYNDPSHNAVERCTEDIERLIALFTALLSNEELILLPASEVF